MQYSKFKIQNENLPPSQPLLSILHFAFCILNFVAQGAPHAR
jgi:hypothetical protein